ncbi:aldehyde dehydrogenase (NADP(+)) [Shewanella sp. NIFS-20-20]|uniref:aldehyde dehydrogenase (NADP(+)) n=1 Tax=Shewanella sp. NIFS-20-20 TaxID=2853806 RepID=UPI001C489111|nr:aldehyde dehydrogenase (NADP(+)) [Shewanella sp. NIFS-20-20]MBV7315127.1 aldehyde dehydrogenase (NADP(+)) [Shewanella sp. NIFS-20-20]
MTPTLLGQHLINGQWLGQATAFTPMDPATNLALSQSFAEADADTIALAVNAASQAFTTYRRASPATRATLLQTIAEEIELAQADIIAIAMVETSLPQARLSAETTRICGQLRLFAQTLLSDYQPRYIDKGDAHRHPLPKPDTRLGYLPLGPVAVFGASNFPLAFSTAGGDTASALAAGCPVIVKAHPAHPGTSECVANAILKALRRCQLPAGIFSLLQGQQPQLSTALVQHPAVAAVGFTGSHKVGRLLADLCAARANPIPFYGELGSSNPQIILPQALARKGATLAHNQVESMLMGHGQFCTSPGLVLVTQGEGLDSYLRTLAADIAERPAANMLTLAISQSYQWQVEQILQLSGVDVIAQGQANHANHANHLIRPYALLTDANSFQQHPILAEEIFGPCVLVVICQSEQERLQLIEQLPGQLTASIHGEDQEVIHYQELVESLCYKVGRIMVNQLPTGVEVCPSMQHGGPYPASTDSRSTSVGSQAIWRFLRPICYQNYPQALLPESLRH